MKPEQIGHEPTHLIEDLDINWAGHEGLFAQILRLRDSRLALAIIEHIYKETDCPLGQLEIGSIEWWLDWLTAESDPHTRYWLQERMSWLLTSCVSKETRHSFVIEFNKPGSKYRSLLARSILLRYNDLTTDDFTSDAISFLLADLNRVGSVDYLGHILGQTATEQFVEERLLPLLPEAKNPLLTNLQRVLRQAGSRHGRRYIFD
jgi:hypothetical protein